MASDRPRVLVLGGGYVSLYLARKLGASIEQGKVDCTIVSRENFQAFHGFIGEMLSGRISASHILSPARRIFSPAQVHVGEIESIDLESSTVITSRRLDGKRTEHHYDQLVVGLGTDDRLDVYPGLAEHGFRLKTYADCFRLRNHILQMFELADIEEDPEERRRLLTFFVAGGGYAGTEIAGELAHLASLLTAKEYRGVRFEECRFVLVEPGPTIIPELYGRDGSGPGAHPRLVELAMRRQAELGVEVRTNTLVTAATPNEVSLSNGERIPARTIISAVGTKPNPLVERLPFEKDDRGRIVVDWCLRVPGRPGIWAGGDSAAVPNPRGGGACPPVAIYAMKHGAKIGSNIARGLTGKRPRRFNYPGIGQGASVGNRYAVAELQGVEVWGFPAWLVWRSLLTYYFPSRDQRLRMMADWLIWPIAGRNILEIQVDRPGDYELRQNRFQPGETILTEGEASRYIHVIVEGEVDLIEVADGDAEEPPVLRTLGPGDHFGVRWIESFGREAARAKTEVRTIALRRDQAPRLQEVLDSAGRLVAESGHFPAITRELEQAARAGEASTPGLPAGSVSPPSTGADG